MLKKIFTLFLVINIIGYSIAADYQFNQNYNFNKYITEGEWKFVTEGNQSVSVDLKKEKLDYLDADGNEVYTYHFIGEKAEFYLVPDNSFFPLTFRLIEANPATNRYYMDNNYGYVVLNENHITRVKARMATPIEANSKTNISIWPDNYDFFNKKMGSKVDKMSLYKGSSKGSPFDTWMDLMKEYNLSVKYNATSSQTTKGSQWPGIPAYYEHQWAFQNKKLDELKNSSVQELLGKFPDGIYYMYSGTDPRPCNNINKGKLKINFERENGKAIGFTVQNCFTDGEFYDKEKFFVKVKIGPKGELTFSNQSSLYILPVDGKFIFHDIFRGELSNIHAAFTPGFVDASIYHWKNHGFWNIAETDHQYFCKSEFEEYYNKDKDKYHLYAFLKGLSKIAQTSSK